MLHVAIACCSVCAVAWRPMVVIVMGFIFTPVAVIVTEAMDFDIPVSSMNSFRSPHALQFCSSGPAVCCISQLHVAACVQLPGDPWQ